MLQGMLSSAYFPILFVVLIVSSEVVSADRSVLPLRSGFRNVLLNLTDPSKRAADDVCNTFTVIFNPGDLLFPQDYQHLKRPWVDNPTATVGTSVIVSQKIHSLLQLQVPGLDGETVETVVQTLKQNGCLSFIIGEMVQDQFLDVSTTANINLQSNCDADTLYNICLEKWGSSKCTHLSRECSVIQIGDVEAIHGVIYPTNSVNWNETFFGNGTSLFYTTNSIAYFAQYCY